MRKFGIIAAIFCLVAAGIFVLMPRAQEASKPQALVVKDSVDREVSLPAHPERVVILNASNLDLFVAAGGADRIVGKPSSQALSPTVVEKTAKAEEVGAIHQPNVEKIISLKPDLVIGTNVPFHIDLDTTLSKLGIPLYIQALDDIPSLFNALSLYGKLTGDEKVAEKQAKLIKDKMAEIEKRAAGKKPPKSLLVFGSPESFNMGTAKCFTGGLIELLGGGNIADKATGDGAYLPLSMEFVARENPTVIFAIVHGPAETLEPKMRRDLQENGAWADVDAVKNGRVYVLPFDLFAINPGIRAADALDVLADIMYPKEK